MIRWKGSHKEKHGNEVGLGWGYCKEELQEEKTIESGDVLGSKDTTKR